MHTAINRFMDRMNYKTKFSEDDVVTKDELEDMDDNEMKDAPKQW